MILNERQYRIASSQIREIESDLSSFDPINLVKAGVDPVVIEAQRRSLQAQLLTLRTHVERYDELRTSGLSVLGDAARDDVGLLLIETRIALGLTQKDLAERLGCFEQQVQRYEQERYKAASVSKVRQIMDALGVVASLNIEMRKHDPDDDLRFDLCRFPLKEMKRRNWFAQLGEYANDCANDAELLSGYVRILSDGGGHARALHKQKVRAGGKADKHALAAWKACILWKAKREVAAMPESSNASWHVDSVFLKELVRLSRLDDGPVQAVHALKTRGIAVVFEPQLPATHLDGAAMLLEHRTPVIGMTLRHDRTDNFWFVLMHELGHIICHREGLEAGFFDDETAPASDDLEREADAFASNALIPDEVWANSFVRFARSPEQVQSFSDKLGVSSAIVAGRIRNERGDFKIFTDLVGHRKVKKSLMENGLMG